MSQMTPNRVVIKGVRYMLAHVPGLVQYGSKPVRELPRDAALREQLGARLRSFDDAAAYPPHQVFLGARQPQDLWALERRGGARKPMRPPLVPTGPSVDRSASY